MGILIDISVLIAHERGCLDVEGRGGARTPIGTHDLWIAASALARGLSLVTLNAREFERVPGLRLEVWG